MSRAVMVDDLVRTKFPPPPPKCLRCDADSSEKGSGGVLALLKHLSEGRESEGKRDVVMGGGDKRVSPGQIWPEWLGRGDRIPTTRPPT